MRMRRLIAAAALGVCVSASAAASELDVNVSNNAARISGSSEVAPRMRLDGGWLHHVDRGNIAHVGLHMVDMATGGAQPVHAGLGGRLVFIDADLPGESAWSVPLGGLFYFNLPDADRIQVGGSAYYAPEVLSFGGGEEYMELNAFVGYEVLREGAVYVGYRYVRSDFDDTPRVTMDTGVHLGLKLRF